MLTRRQQFATKRVASNAIFHIPELLENILSNLDFRTLLTSAQRVNHYWHAVIKGSSLLQRLLFFQPEPQLYKQDDSFRVRNPLLVGAFPTWFPNGMVPPRGYHREAFTRLPMCHTPKKKAFMREGASWRRMLISQPPPLTLGCWMTEHWSGCVPDENCWKFKIQEFPQGLRMGKLYDLSVRWLGSMPSAQFNVYWTPQAYDTLQGFYLWRTNQTYLEALRKCGAAVDFILRGERWDAPHTPCKRKDAQLGGLLRIVMRPEKNYWSQLKTVVIRPSCSGKPT